jgi:predicted component of type VI protein secretion system
METATAQLRTPVPDVAGKGERILLDEGKIPHMQLTLVVMTHEKDDGRTIQINVNPFRIGRDPQCHLRPASPFVSKQHCALLIQGNQVLLRDFNSTNGTFVNGLKVEKEKELQNSDRIEIGPLVFGVRIQPAIAPVDKPTPLPITENAVQTDKDTAVELGLPRLSENPQPSWGGDSRSVSANHVTPGPSIPDSPKQKPDSPAEESGDTSAAAKHILDNYLRRRRK